MHNKYFIILLTLNLGYSLLTCNISSTSHTTQSKTLHSISHKYITKSHNSYNITCHITLGLLTQSPQKLGTESLTNTYTANKYNLHISYNITCHIKLALQSTSIYDIKYSLYNHYILLTHPIPQKLAIYLSLTYYTPTNNHSIHQKTRHVFYTKIH